MTRGLGARRGIRPDSQDSNGAAALWQDIVQVAWGTRWISGYVCSLILGFIIPVGLLTELNLDVARIVSPLFYSPFLGYLSSVWLLAACNFCNGRSALGVGCFSASRRQIGLATVLCSGFYFLTLAPQWVGHFYTIGRASYAALVMLALPRVVLGGQSLRFAIVSGIRALRRRPTLVVSSLAIGLAVCGGLEWLGDWAYGLLVEVVVHSERYGISAVALELLRFPATLFLANLALMAMKIAGWLVTAPISFCLYWRLSPWIRGE